jgi:fructose-bisphosphate aldolase class II
MPLVHLNDMLKHASHHHYAVGAFGVSNLDFVAGVLQAAEACRSPVVLNLIEAHSTAEDFELLMPAVLSAARKASVPVAVNFDHGTSKERAEAAIRAGCNGVMVDTSALPFSDNLWQTREIVAMAHACDITVEGELGYVPGKEGQSAEQHPGELAFTSATEAAGFVERTGVDCLAVSIGTIHGRMKGIPKLDYARLAKIREAVAVPLVIHGGSGLSDEQYRKLIAHGIAKINYYTALVEVAGRSIKEHLNGGRKIEGNEMTVGVRIAVRDEALRCMGLWGSGGRAAEVLAQCNPWQEAQYMLVCDSYDSVAKNGMPANLNGLKKALEKSPGVRSVLIGRCEQPDGKLRYSLSVHFASYAALRFHRQQSESARLLNNTVMSYAKDCIALDIIEC